MQKIFFIFSILSLTVLVYFFINYALPRDNVEIELYQKQVSPDGLWTAVAQEEIFNTAVIVNDANYVIRIKGNNQVDSEGDLVLSVPVNYPEQGPRFIWVDSKHLKILTDNTKYDFFKNFVDGITAKTQHK